MYRYTAQAVRLKTDKMLSMAAEFRPAPPNNMSIDAIANEKQNSSSRKVYRWRENTMWATNGRRAP
jgi:hypothetical protein